MKKLIFTFALLIGSLAVIAQDIPEHVSYTRIYDYLDELANDGVIELNSVIKPYSRKLIAQKLIDAQQHEKQLNRRQQKELQFFLNEFALELNQLPASYLNIVNTENTRLACIQPAVSYRDTLFKARISPLLGMTVTHNDNGNITKRWYGIDFQSSIGKYLSVYGSLRDVSVDGALLARPGYLNDYPGYEYKESAKGGDFSDSRGGIKLANSWGSIGLVKDNIIWGDNYHGSNILSGRAPSFPMITLSLKPVKWFEMNYIHGWLVSNVLDSTQAYYDTNNNKFYRMKNKFIAANMFTITPFRKFNFSFGNSIIYAEQNIQPSYLIPIAFYKSIDHTLTKGAGLENQNSQVFLNISSRNIKHLHLFTSIYADEISISRFKKSDKENNPISYKLGANLTNFPINNLALTGEFTRNAIIVYKHPITALTWASNGYNLGNYLGDNSQEMYLALKYKPIRGLDISLSMVDAKHGNEFKYIRREANKQDATSIFLSQPVLGEISWTNRTFAFNAQYEVFQNAYAIVKVEHSNILGYDLTGTPIANDQSEVLKTAQGYLDMFTPSYLQGKNLTFTVGFSLGF
jgi:hypothetical protein